MKHLFIISLLLLTGCSTLNPNQQALRQAIGNFHYEADKDDEWRIYDAIDKPFKGDCEDFALTLQKKIGGQVWYVAHKTQGAHAVLIKDEVTYDFLLNRSMPIESYPGKPIYIMN